jgi:hypothetical protein
MRINLWKKQAKSRNEYQRSNWPSQNSHRVLALKKQTKKKKMAKEKPKKKEEKARKKKKPKKKKKKK